MAWLRRASRADTARFAPGRMIAAQRDERAPMAHGQKVHRMTP
ncbi:hypothetical protein [Burkholderia sp. Ac-20344]|nr:hypothetical protein [Burkholderia sp. Ac-20344]